MTNNTISQTKSDALKHIETQIEFAESLIAANRAAIKTLHNHWIDSKGQYSKKAFDEDVAELKESITRAEGRISGLVFAREELLALD